MRLIIQANAASVSQEELKSKLTQSQLNQVKGKNLVAYTVAEEGESHPVVLGEGSRNLQWPRTVIQKVKDAIQAGTGLFNRHNSDNSTSGRPSVGEVLTSYTKEIGGKLRTIAVACMEAADAIKYDVCSIEANIFEENGIVHGVEKVTGIAVSSSKLDQPAFRNAKRMQIVQCFTGTEEPPQTGKEKETMPITLNDLMSAPIDLFKQAVTAREMHPSQLFSLESMQKDRELTKIFTERTEAQTKVAELTKELEAGKEAIAKAEKAVAVSKAGDLFNSRLPEGITEKQKSFLTSRFKPETMDKLDESSVDEFIKAGQEEYKNLAKLFGGEGSTETDPPAGDQTEPSESEVSLEDAFNEL